LKPVEALVTVGVILAMIALGMLLIRLLDNPARPERHVRTRGKEVAMNTVRLPADSGDEPVRPGTAVP
jgi:hypothetical protein